MASLESLDVHLVTFNCARQLIDIDCFSSCIFTRSPRASPPPDLIVLCLQEVAPIAYAFLGGSLLVPYFRRFVQAVNNASDAAYEAIAVRNVGLTAMMVLVNKERSPFVRQESFAGVGVGHWRMGNKGAVGMRLQVGSQAKAHVTFVSAHLAPMENEYRRRNQDWRNIVAGLIFTKQNHSKHGPDNGGEAEPLLASPTAPNPGNEESSMFESHTPVFFAGDLNYRTSDSSPPVDGYKHFPQPDVSSEAWFEAWKERDQLNRERLRQSTLNYLDELPVRFPPTYKYEPDETRSWPKDGSEPAVYNWAKHRYPSWCDRILFSYQLTQQKDSPLEAMNYEALPVQPTSDHRPVLLSFKLDLRPFYDGEDAIKQEEPFVNKDPHWATSRARARRLEIVVGAGAYLALTWEGNMLLLATLTGAGGAYFILRSMI